MNIPALFVARPVATTLLTVAIALAGLLAYAKLPVASLPQVDLPTIVVTAKLPGATPDTVASSVAEPLERYLGQIADVTEMTSQSTLGQAQIVLQFGLDRDIDGAARDVEAAINAAHADLPTDLRSNPTYRKVNPASAPVLILALTSKTLNKAQLYDAASRVLQQRLSQIPGVGQFALGGASLPAVRIELNPTTLFHYGIGLEDVRAALASANADSPKGTVDDANGHWQINTNDQANRASDYRPLVVAWRNGAAVRLSDLGDVVDSVEDLRNVGLYNGDAAVMALLFRRPGANVIETIDQVKAVLPYLRSALPGGTQLTIIGDFSNTIRASLHDTELTLIISVILVTLVVFAFLRDWRATLVPATAVPVSIIGTFAAMYLLGFSLDNLSLMALTISTGFVVDDAIVVQENIVRHLDAGVPRLKAAVQGAGEVAFTVLSMSASLIAVFIPILFMGGVIGRLFREFALTLSVAILVSLVVSFTTTPMMCALFLREQLGGHAARPGMFDRLQSGYVRSLGWALRHRRVMLVVLVATVGINVLLIKAVPKGAFPIQDTGRMLGSMTPDQGASFEMMQQQLAQGIDIIKRDPAVEAVVGFSGAGGPPTASAAAATLFVSLKPLGERTGAAGVVTRLAKQLDGIAGARFYLNPVQEIGVGGRQSNAAYQYTLEADSPKDVYSWTPKLVAALQGDKRLQDVSADLQQNGRQANLTIDRDTAARLAITPMQIDSTLYDAFGQRQVSVIYSAQNQYHVVMEVAPRYWQDPQMLNQVWVSTSGGTASGTQTTNALPGTISQSSTTSGATTAATLASTQSARNAATNGIATVGHGSSSSAAAVSVNQETMIPLAAVTRLEDANTPLTVNHQGPFVVATISFNLPPGGTLDNAVAAVAQASRKIGMPATIHGKFGGTAKVFQESLSSEPILLAAALVAMYLVLGVLYESFVHPLTILSTLPSAGVGAVLALLLTGTEFSIIALIGIILLIGIVKKNAIMMIDFAVVEQRDNDRGALAAITEACRLRFRPIMMTTMTALLGALPLVLSFGEGSELRRPLGIAIVGGLIVSQVLTLYTTPAVYITFDRFQRRPLGGRSRLAGAAGAAE
jgi:multidrug efflux pump